jgi:hypothetical protein
MVTWIAEKSACLHEYMAEMAKAMYYGGWRIMLLLLRQ